MSWPLNTVEAWVQTALLRLGYSAAQATLGAQSVTWLQQRNAPGVAAMAQHIDFLSAFKLTPNHEENDEASCPIVLAESLRHTTDPMLPPYFKSVRQPLLLIPTLVALQGGGTLSWDETEITVSDAPLNIDYDRKTLRTVLVEKADLNWAHKPLESSDEPPIYLTEIPSRELVYVKTLQHYAGTLPPREPLDGADPSDNSSSSA